MHRAGPCTACTYVDLLALPIFGHGLPAGVLARLPNSWAVGRLPKARVSGSLLLGPNIVFRLRK